MCFYQTATTLALYDYTTGQGGCSADNLHNLDGLGIVSQTVPKMIVSVNEDPGQPIWHCLGFDQHPTLK
jgi:hypothetical protein